LNKKEIYDNFKNLELQTRESLTQLQLLQTELSRVIEENAELEIENQHLRDLLNNAKDNTGREPQLSKSRQNLEKLYEEGFHVCKEWYGKRREDDDSCAFCMEVIYRDR